MEIEKVNKDAKSNSIYKEEDTVVPELLNS